MIFHEYSVVLFIVAIFQVFLFLMIWPKRHVRGGIHLAGFAASSGFWAFAGAFEMAVTPQNAKVLWSAISYLGICTSPIFFFFFVLEYAQMSRFVKKKYFKYFWVIPVITVIGAFTNQWHHLLWRDFTWADTNVLVYWYGPLFWVNSLHIYLLLSIGLVLLVYTALKFRDVYRRQLLVVLLGAIAPFLANFIYLLKLEPIIGFDLTPLSFLLTSAALTWVLLRYDFLDLVPVAHDMILTRMKSAILILDNINRVIEINSNMKRLFDLDELKIGQPLDILQESFPKFLSICKENSYYEGELSLNLPEKKYFDISISEIFDSNKQMMGKLVLLYDITQKKTIEKQLMQKNALLEDRIYEVEQLQEKLKEQALKDPLTGLYNRRYLTDVFSKELSRAERESSTIGICMIDIDNFKKVNDSCGHDAGDMVLVKVSSIIKSMMRKTDYICRFGGDELIIIITKISKKDLVTKVEQFRKAVSENDYTVAGVNLNITLSVGISMYPYDGSTFEQLMQKSDMALYASKREGRNRQTEYDKSLEQA